MNGLNSSELSDAGILSRMNVLGDPVRCRLLLLCESQPLRVSELCDVVQLPQSTVSRHLKTLSEDGWLESTKDGTSRRYSARDLSPGPALELWHIVRSELADSARAREDLRRLGGVLARRKSRSQQFFSSSAGRWTELRKELFGQRFDLEAALAFLDESWAVGDFGCGTGNLAAALAPHVRRVVAVDESPEMLAAAGERLASFANVEVLEGTLEKLPVVDGALDAAAIVLVLHHLEDPAAALSGAVRTLRAGGHLLVVDMLPHERAEFRIEMGHVWMGFGEEQIREWLDEAGLERVRIRTLTGRPEANGPSLFVARGTKTTKPDTSENRSNQ